MAQGTEAGKKSGHDQALAEHRTQLTQVIQALTASLANFNKQRQTLETEATADVVALAMAIARRVTKRQTDLDPGVLTANLSEIMKLVVHAADLRIVVHPSQKEMLLKELPNLQLQWPALTHAELIDEPTSPFPRRVPYAIAARGLSMLIWINSWIASWAEFIAGKRREINHGMNTDEHR